MKKNLKVSLIIATMNRSNSVRETIESIKKSTVYPDEIILIDQSDDDRTKKVANEYENELNIYYHHQEKSLTNARNKGFMMAKNEILIFMDDDVIIKENTIENVINIFQTEDRVSMISGIDLNGDISRDSIFGYFFGKKNWFKRKKGYVTNSMFGRFPIDLNKRSETEWAMGFFFVVRKSLITKWNIKWDERFISYGYPEDLDFSYRYYLKSKSDGYHCILEPNVAVYHMVSKEWRESSRKVTFMIIINREYLTYKFERSFISRFCTRWTNFGIFLERIIKKDNPFDVLKAQYYCDKYRKDIKNGNLHIELYEEVRK